MSIHFSGTFTRSAGVISAITKQLKFVNLKPVKKIEVQFDPFQEHAVTARNFMHHISSNKVARTNPNCAVRANVVCDRSEPKITVHLLEAGTVTFLANNLTVLEILQQFNKHISSTVKVEEKISTNVASVTAKKKKSKK